MAILKTIGAILTIIGGILLAIMGITQLYGAVALPGLSGITDLVLGIGLILLAIPLLAIPPVPPPPKQT